MVSAGLLGQGTGECEGVVVGALLGRAMWGNTNEPARKPDISRKILWPAHYAPFDPWQRAP